MLSRAELGQLFHKHTLSQGGALAVDRLNAVGRQAMSQFSDAIDLCHEQGIHFGLIFSKDVNASAFVREGMNS